MRTLALAALLSILPACATRQATSRTLPRERASECATHCDTLGMRLSAVVIIMDSAGCVCEPRGAASPAPAAAAVAGGAALVAAQEAEQRRRASQQPGAAHTGIR